MKTLIKIKSYEVGLVFKEKKLVKVLTEGTQYWKSWKENLNLYSIFQPFILTDMQSILLENKELKSLLNIYEVTEQELLFKYKDGLFQEVLEKGKYAFWKNPLKTEYKKVVISNIEVPKEIADLLKSNYKLGSFMSRYEVLSNEKALLLVEDKLVKELDSGSYTFWKNNKKVELKKVDLRQQIMEVNGQEILTQDKANLRINLDAKFAVITIEKALLENKDYQKMLYVLLQTKLRAYIGQFTLDQLLENKSNLGDEILKMVIPETESLGVKVYQADIRDIILPGDVKEIMNQVLVAQKKAQANTISRREETAATRSLLNTAKLMEDNPMLYQLKEMEYVEKIADKIGEITVSGNGGMVKQLKEIFSVKD